MRFYLATSFIFPRSFRLRLFAVCFLAMHLPLFTYLGLGVATGHFALTEFLVLAAATLAGTVLALIAIGALLQPIHVAAEALAAVEQGEPVTPLPEGRDVVGKLLHGVTKAARGAEARVRASDLAAREDLLTGVYNRRGFLADLEARAPEQRRGAIALIDLDYFKRVNDTLGHEVGDRVLRDFAERLSTSLRRDDVVARWGGEEFAVLFCNAIEEEAANVLERIARSLTAKPLVRINGRPMTFSAGVSRFGEQPLEVVLHLADAALYEAKHAGRNCVCRAGDGGLLVLGREWDTH